MPQNKATYPRYYYYRVSVEQYWFLLMIMFPVMNLEEDGHDLELVYATLIGTTGYSFHGRPSMNIDFHETKAPYFLKG